MTPAIVRLPSAVNPQETYHCFWRCFPLINSQESQRLKNSPSLKQSACPVSRLLKCPAKSVLIALSWQSGKIGTLSSGGSGFESPRLLLTCTGSNPWLKLVFCNKSCASLEGNIQTVSFHSLWISIVRLQVLQKSNKKFESVLLRNRGGGSYMR